MGPIVEHWVVSGGMSYGCPLKSVEVKRQLFLLRTATFRSLKGCQAKSVCQIPKRYIHQLPTKFHPHFPALRKGLKAVVNRAKQFESFYILCYRTLWENISKYRRTKRSLIGLCCGKFRESRRKPITCGGRQEKKIRATQTT